jgi:hypothetical protein
MGLVESIGDPTLTIGLAFAAIVAKHQTGEPGDVLRWTQMVIDLAEGDPTKGAFILGSPLSAALAWRGVARWQVGIRGWREDFSLASELAREADPLSQAAVIAYKYTGLPRGVLLADGPALEEIETALALAARSSDDMALVLLRMTFATALIHHGAERQSGFEQIRLLRETCVEEQFALNIVPFLDAYLALSTAEQGQPDLAVAQLRVLADDMLRDKNFANADLAICFLAETLLSQGHIDDAAEEIERLAGTNRALGWITRDVTVLRLRALVAHARGDNSTYCELRDRYRAVASDLGFEGHMAWAQAMA